MTLVALLEHYEKRFCEIILNVDEWLLRRCGLNKILCFALVAII